jgi:hypothetical protein
LGVCRFAASSAIFRSSSIAFRSSSTALSIASIAVWHFIKDSITLSVFPRSCPAPAANVFTQFRRLLPQLADSMLKVSQMLVLKQLPFPQRCALGGFPTVFSEACVIRSPQLAADSGCPIHPECAGNINNGNTGVQPFDCLTPLMRDSLGGRPNQGR